MKLRQSTAVSIGGRALLIEGPPGSGKSSLALSLIDRGAVLIGDDGIMLARHGDRLIVAPAPATEGLIELRGIGLFTFPAVSAPAALVLRLGEAAERYPAMVERVSIADRQIPVLSFDPANPAAAVRAEHALAMHGLPLSDGTVQDRTR